MKVKLCGITSVEQMKELQVIGVDYAGIIFYEKSKRFAADKLKNQKSEIRNLKIKKVGVFVNAGINTILKAIEGYDLAAVQLHGDETPVFCSALVDKTKVIKVFRITGTENIDELVKPYQAASDYFMFDTAPSNSPERGESTTKGPLLKKQENIRSSGSVQWVIPPSGEPEGAYGGTGEKFDWNILQKHKINKPFFLSGGIGLADVSRLKLFNHLHFNAVDVNSRFEIEPGLKDLNKVEQFVKQLKDG
ncbi:MAG: phosphoribosylanthranilate isomerase [Chitinophagaceae bacterium]